MLHALILSLFAVLIKAFYVIQDDYTPISFADKFDFFTDTDPTHGYVNYVDQNTAQSLGLFSVDDNQIYMGVDHTNVASGRGRDSVRISSKNTYNHGLFILDLAHMPGGQCGTWPAFWLLGPNWPGGGEVDIIEGVNSKKINGMALHTTPGCTISNRGQFSGELLYANCDINAASQPYNSGCAIDAARDDSYGTGFNAIGGGVYVTEWTSDHIAIWFFPRSAIPADITSGEPNPENWGLPLSDFSGDCDIDSKFSDQQIIFDITFCGDWAGYDWNFDVACNSRASNCNNFVQNNPAEFSDTYWRINSLRVFQDNGLSTSPRTSSTSTTTSITTRSTAVTTITRSTSSTASTIDTNETRTTTITRTVASENPMVPSFTSSTNAIDQATTSSSVQRATPSVNSFSPSSGLSQTTTARMTTLVTTSSMGVETSTSTVATDNIRTTGLSMNPTPSPSANLDSSIAATTTTVPTAPVNSAMQSGTGSRSGLSNTSLLSQITTISINSTQSPTSTNLPVVTSFSTSGVRWLNSTASFTTLMANSSNTTTLNSSTTSIPELNNTSSGIFNTTTATSLLLSLSSEASITAQPIIPDITITLTKIITSCPPTTDTSATAATSTDVAQQTASPNLDSNGGNDDSGVNGQSSTWTHWSRWRQ